TGGKPAHGIFDVTNGGATPFVAPSTWPPATANGPLVGEVGYNLKWLLGSTIASTGYDISFDSAPSFYINGQPQAVDSSGHVSVPEPGVPQRRVRVHPRRLFERYRADVAGRGRARREERRARRLDVDRSHRHRPDDHGADRVEDGLPARRSRDHADPHAVGGK